MRVSCFVCVYLTPNFPTILYTVVWCHTVVTGIRECHNNNSNNSIYVSVSLFSTANTLRGVQTDEISGPLFSLPSFRSIKIPLRNMFPLFLFPLKIKIIISMTVTTTRFGCPLWLLSASVYASIIASITQSFTMMSRKYFTWVYPLERIRVLRVARVWTFPCSFHVRSLCLIFLTHDMLL